MPQEPIQSPDVAVFHIDSIPESDLEDLKSAVEEQGMRFHSASREASPQAGIEWLLLPAVAVFISKSYFDGILKEIGKDHYGVLKRGWKSLWSRFLGPAAPRMVVLGTEGKVRDDQPYSPIYSVIAEAGPKLRFKLMFPIDLSEDEYDKAVGAFFSFLKEFHSQSLAGSMLEKLQAARVVGGTVLLVYNQAEAELRVIDPLSSSLC